MRERGRREGCSRPCTPMTQPEQKKQAKRFRSVRPNPPPPPPPFPPPPPLPDAASSASPLPSSPHLPFHSSFPSLLTQRPSLFQNSGRGAHFPSRPPYRSISNFLPSPHLTSPCPVLPCPASLHLTLPTPVHFHSKCSPPFILPSSLPSLSSQYKMFCSFSQAVNLFALS